jgi:hypothetical protein
MQLPPIRANHVGDVPTFRTALGHPGHEPFKTSVHPSPGLHITSLMNSMPEGKDNVVRPWCA